MAEIKTRARRGRKATAPDEIIKGEMVLVSDIVLDSDVQPRESISPTLIKEYAEAMSEGAEFPPVVLFRDAEGTLVAADGWHRVRAARDIGRAEIKADIYPGDRREAILYSVSANATHGSRRTDADKRRAVQRLLTDPEWSQWSASVIAEKVGVSQPFVSGMRRQLDDGDGDGEVRTADGRTMRTGTLGGRGGRRRQEPAGTNGHATVQQPSGGGDALAALSAEPLTLPSPTTVDPVAQYGAMLAEVFLQFQQFDPTEVVRTLDLDVLRELGSRWNDIIDGFDAYSLAVDQTLSEAPTAEQETDEDDDQDDDEDEDDEEQGAEDQDDQAPVGDEQDDDQDADDDDDEEDEEGERVE